ncbi:MAG: tetraacyldisaccharide 4'-kinase [Candidatus Cloacimonetes bacterium]|nr:tetraacyldisaccharide 4'-kinase [Candidatus Cloacimonadota bacterium]
MVSQRFIAKNLQKRSWLSWCLYPLSLLWTLIHVVRRWLHLKILSLPRVKGITVISVGNLISGGSGRTPLVIFLARYLSEKGQKVAVCIRGYKGLYEENTTIISDITGLLPEAENAGDEAQLLTEKLPGIPVVVGKNRFVSVQMIRKRFPDISVVILDDAFQNFTIQHDLDFLIFDSWGGIGNGFTIPAGLLREPLSAAKFADCLVANGEAPIPLTGKPILRTGYQLESIYNAFNEIIPIDSLEGKQVLAVSGIGQPRSFEKTIREAGGIVQNHLAFTDHHAYSQKNISEIRRKLAASSVVCVTEKDWVKLRKLDLKGIPFYVLHVGFQITDKIKLDKLLNVSLCGKLKDARIDVKNE